MAIVTASLAQQLRCSDPNDITSPDGALTTYESMIDGLYNRAHFVYATPPAQLTGPLVGNKLYFEGIFPPANNDTIRLWFWHLNSGRWFAELGGSVLLNMYAYNTANTVSTTAAITGIVPVLGNPLDGPNTYTIFTMTTAFISELANLGDNTFAVRIIAQRTTTGLSAWAYTGEAQGALTAGGAVEIPVSASATSFAFGDAVTSGALFLSDTVFGIADVTPPEASVQMPVSASVTAKAVVTDPVASLQMTVSDSATAKAVVTPPAASVQLAVTASALAKARHDAVDTAMVVSVSASATAIAKKVLALTNPPGGTFPLNGGGIATATVTPPELSVSLFASASAAALADVVAPVARLTLAAAASGEAIATVVPPVAAMAQKVSASGVAIATLVAPKMSMSSFIAASGTALATATSANLGLVGAVTIDGQESELLLPFENFTVISDGITWHRI